MSLSFSRTMSAEEEQSALNAVPKPTRGHLYSALVAEGFSLRDIAVRAGIQEQSVRNGLAFHVSGKCFHCKKAGVV